MPEIIAVTLTTKDVDDDAQVGSLSDQIDGPLASFTCYGAYDQDSVYQTVSDRDSDVMAIVPTCCTAVMWRATSFRRCASGMATFPFSRITSSSGTRRPKAGKIFASPRTQ